MTKVDLTPAFLIHRRAFKDSSLLLDFFTRDHGKIRLVGRGLRKSKTNIQMFQRLNISFTGRSELKSLSHWEVDDSPRAFKGDALILGMYVNELIARLLQEHDPHDVLFELYTNFVHQMGNLEQSTRHWLLRLFESNLLSELGYGIDYSLDMYGKVIDRHAFYEYQPQSGFIKSEMGKISGKMLSQMFAESLDDQPDPVQLKVCRDINRQRLSVLLGDKPLKSRELYFRE